MGHDPLTRRTFLQGTTAFLATTAMGFASMALGGCAGPEVSEQDQDEMAREPEAADISLSVQDNTFSIAGGPPIAFSTERLSLLPHVAEEAIYLAYQDEDDQPQQIRLGDLGNSVSIQGDLGMLTVDGIEGWGRIVVDKEAHVSVLSLGSIQHADIGGSVSCLLVTDCADVTTWPGSSIENVVASSRGGAMGSIEGIEGNCIQHGFAPEGSAHDRLAQVTSAGTVPVDDALALQMNGQCLVVFGDDDPQNDMDWRALLPETLPTADEGQVTEGEQADVLGEMGTIVSRTLGPTVAYAEELPAPDEAMPPDAPDVGVAEPDPTVLEGDAIEVTLDKADEADHSSDEGLVDVAWQPEVSDDELHDLMPSDVTDVSVPYPDENELKLLVKRQNVLGKGFEQLISTAYDTAKPTKGKGVWDVVFGDKVARMLDGSELELELEDTFARIEDLLGHQSHLAFATQVDNYLGTYGIPLVSWLAVQESVRTTTNKDNWADYAQNLLNPSVYPTGETAITEAAVHMGNMLLQTLTATSTNVLGAFDQLMVHAYPWEHQTYQLRLAFQQAVLEQYLLVAGYAQFALRNCVATLKDDPDRREDYLLYRATQDALFRDPADESHADEAQDDELYVAIFESLVTDGGRQGIVPRVARMYADQQVSMRSSSLRCLQEPAILYGQNKKLVLSAQAITAGCSKEARNNQRHLMGDAAGHLVPTQEQLHTLRTRYPEGTSLDDILYRKEEGCLAKPKDQKAPYIIRGLPFAERAFQKDGEGWCYVVDVACQDVDGKDKAERVFWKKRVDGGWEEHVHDASFNCLYFVSEETS